MPLTDEQEQLFGIDKLNAAALDLPAITHVDYSARVQTVHRGDQPALPRAARRRSSAQTGCGVIINTSFNVRGEPIVCTPEDAYRCFMRTEMDYLVLGNFVMRKPAQPAVPKDERWRTEFELD